MQRKKLPNSAYFDGSDYTSDEAEFIRAMGEYVRTRNKRPTFAEVLAIAKSLGYRKVVDESHGPPTTTTEESVPDERE